MKHCTHLRWIDAEQYDWIFQISESPPTFHWRTSDKYFFLYHNVKSIMDEAKLFFPFQVYSLFSHVLRLKIDTRFHELCNVIARSIRLFSFLRACNGTKCGAPHYSSTRWFSSLARQKSTSDGSLSQFCVPSVMLLEKPDFWICSSRDWRIVQ